MQKRKLAVESDFHHHDWVTHTIPFYLLLLGLPAALSALAGWTLAWQLLAVALAGCLAHLFQDLLWTNGIMLGWPFERRLRAIFITHENVVDQLASYQRSTAYRLERILIAVAGLLLALYLALRLNGHV